MTRKNIITLVFVIGLAVLFWSSSLLQDYFKQGAEFIQDYGESYFWQSVVIFVVLSTVSAMLIAISSIWMVPAAIVLWGNFLTVSLLLASWLVGAIFSYVIGRYGGYRLVKMAASEDKIRHYEELIGRKLGLLTIFLFRFALPSEITGYVLGIFRYPFIKYLFITFLSEIPYAFYAVYAADSVTNKKTGTFFILVGAWTAIVLLLAHLYFRKTKSNNTLTNSSL